MKKKVALIFGGNSVERDISVITAVQTYKALDSKKYDVMPVFLHQGDFYTGDIKSIKDFAPFQPTEHKKILLYAGKFYHLKKNKLSPIFKPNIVVNCCHGGEGENGVLASVLAFNGLPHTSAGVLSSALCMDKAESKVFFESMMLNVTKHSVFSKKEYNADSNGVVEHLENFLDYPMIVKPSRLGSSIGIGVARDRQALQDAIEIAIEFDDKILVERKLTGFVEVNCAVFKGDDRVIVSQTEQPLSSNDFLSFDDKYSAGKMSGGGHIIPAEIGDLNQRVKEISKKIYYALDLDGVVRIDYLVDMDRQKIYVNEVNTVPGSMAYYLFEREGISFSDMMDKIIEQAEKDFLCQKSRLCNFTTDILTNFKGGSKSQKLK